MLGGFTRHEMRMLIESRPTVVTGFVGQTTNDNQITNTKTN